MLNILYYLNIVGQLKPTNCGREVIPSRLVKHMFDIILINYFN